MGVLTTADVLQFGATVVADPARLGWPPTLPIELALKTASPQQLKEEYGYSDEAWDALRVDPGFLKDLTQALETVRQEGMSFKLKAKLQAEELLKQSWKLIHSPGESVPPSVKADLIKATMRWAGYDNKDTATAAVANGLSINIHMG